MQVTVGIVDSELAPSGASLNVRTLTTAARLQRTAGRLLLVVAVGAIITVTPLVHLCGVVLLLTATPLAAYFTWRTSAVTQGPQQVPCPKCTGVVTIEANTNGWPIRVFCPSCAASLDISPSSEK